jgi:hypothetical protein
MQYLTFTEYTGKGGKLNELDFNQAEFAARQKINEMTRNRIKDASENVKMCVLGLINRGYCGALDGKDYTSEGSGRLSGSYESKQGKAEQFIRTCLSGEPGNLFYAGNV